MSQTIDCPHQQPSAMRGTCPGCTTGSVEELFPWCSGEITGTIVHDSDGDASVINGIRHFVTVEDLELTCGCVLSSSEEQSVIEELAELVSEPLDMGDDLEFPY